MSLSFVWVFISFRTSSIVFGFTARMIMPDSSASFLLSAVISVFLYVDGVLPVAMIGMLFFCMQSIIAFPRFPAPIIPIFIFYYLRSG